MSSFAGPRPLFVALISAIALSMGCGGGGGGDDSTRRDSSSTVSDIAAYFPFEEGALWYYDSREPFSTLPGSVPFERILHVTGEKVIAGRVATVFRETASDGHVPPFETYLVKDAQGITNVGTDDAMDAVTPQLTPYPEVVFTAPLGEAVLQFDRESVSLGEDGDFDGIPETADIRSEVTLEAIEGVSVPAGSFADALVIHRRTTYEVTYTSDGSREVLIENDRRWFARGVGLVRAVFEIRTDEGGFVAEGGDELIGYSIGDARTGILPEALLAVDVPDEPWHRPVSASNGDGAVVVYCSAGVGDPNAGYFAVHVDHLGTPGPPARITHGRCQGAPAIATDGDGYLVVFQRDHPDYYSVAEVAAARLDDAGVPIDPVNGFAVSDAGVEHGFGASVVFDGSDYVVVYTDGSLPFYTPAVEAVRVSRSAAVSVPVEVDTGGFFLHWRSAAWDGEHVLVVGENDPALSGVGEYGIYGFFLDADFAPVGSPFAIAIGTEWELPRVAFDGENYMAVWTGSVATHAAYAMRISRGGVLLDGSPATAIEIPFGDDDVELAFDGDEWIVVGAESRWLRLGRISRDGAGPGESGVLIAKNPNPSYPLAGIALAAAGEELFITWLETHPFSVADLRGRVFYSD